MNQHVLLNNVEHRDLRVRTGHGPGLGDEVMCALTFPGEFRSVQAHYPIVFRRDAGVGFQPLALFGLRAGHNLFLQGDCWDATYVPLSIQRQPFLVGVSGEEPLVHVDLGHPRVGHADGEALFHAHGGATELLQRYSSILLALHEGIAATPAFIEALLRHELLESFVLDVQLEDGQASRMSGFHAIDEDRLQALDGAVLEALSREGHLLPIYMALASTSRLRDLIARMERRHAGGR